MEPNRRNAGSLVGGALLIAFGGLALLSQLFRGFEFWGTFWPFIVIGVGIMFFVGMFAGGKAVSGLAIPGSIITVIGLMLFIQNLTDHWESWAYGWTVIVMSVGVGIFIAGAYAGSEHQRRAGERLFRIGLILFVVFGAFFEMIFHSFSLANIAFPIMLILLGLYLILARSGLLSARNKAAEVSPETK